MVPGKHTSNTLTNGKQLQSRLAGSSGLLTVDRSGSAIKIKSTGTTPAIVKPDILAGDNGVLHVINGMLIPVRLPGLPNGN